MPALQPKNRSSTLSSLITSAPINDENNFPYNYIVVIDAGSRGSTAYIYSWKSMKYYLNSEESNLIDDLIGSKTISEFLPQLIYNEQWHKKIKPSIGSSIVEFGFHDSYLYNYLDNLIAKIYNIIPIEQHYRTPIFFHATAGLRALDPDLQNKIQLKICNYFQSHTDFYFPDCTSHVNILDGDIEGLYSWITLNYLANNNHSIVNIDNHSYGLLELGDGSAQICFEPTESEREIHNIQLLNLNLNENYQVFSTSFLGYGLNQFYHDYLISLIHTSNKIQGNQNNKQIMDPCLPSNYSNKLILNDIEYTFIGSSDFSNCKNNIYSVIADNNEQCNSLIDDSNDTIKISKCMITKSMPEFSIDNDNFIGISGYWDTINTLLGFTNNPQNFTVLNSQIYDPEIFLNATESICAMDWNALSDYNLHNGKSLKNSEILSFCFKSTYVSALLHSGYGLTNEYSESNHLLIGDKINDFQFTWTLGRALLYAIDESTREYNDYLKNSDKKLDSKIGYYRNSAPTLFYHGSEQEGIPIRPDFKLSDKYTIYEFNTKLENDDNDDATEILYGKSNKVTLIQIILIFIIFFTILFASPFTRKLLNKIYEKTKSLIHSYSTFNHYVGLDDSFIDGENELTIDDFNDENPNNNNNNSSGTIITKGLRKYNFQKDTNNELELQQISVSAFSEDQNEVISDFSSDFSDGDWDNDSDGIERAV